MSTYTTQTRTALVLHGLEQASFVCNLPSAITYNMGKIQWNLWARAWVLAGAWSTCCPFSSLALSAPLFHILLTSGSRVFLYLGSITAGAFFAISCMFYTQDSGKVDGRYLAYYLWYVLSLPECSVLHF